VIQVTNETFKMNIVTKDDEVVRYEILDKNEDQGTIIAQLLFKNIEEISNSPVRH